MALNTFAFHKLFKAVLQFGNEKYGENCHSIISYSITAPCSDGENFLSEIYSIKVAFKVNQDNVTHDFIAKSQLVDANSETDFRRYLFSMIFTKEKLLYSDMSEKMSSLLSGLDQEFQLCPKLHTFYTEGDAYSCLLMDNLTSQGFFSPDTHGAGVQLEDSILIVQSLAKFHALSLVIEGQDQVPFPENHEILSAEFFFNDSLADSLGPIVQGSYSGILELAQKFRPDLVPFLSELDQKEAVWKRLSRLVKPGATSFSCLCHGDPRLNNIFLKRNSTPYEVRFIDFQLTRFASPLTDLQYFLYVSSTREFREQNTKTVLKAYHSQFQNILNSFPHIKMLPEKEHLLKTWTLEKLEAEYENMYMYGFLMAMALLPLILLRPGDIDTSVGQMGKEEREQFWVGGRKQMVFELGCKHEDVRKRFFDICDEASARYQKMVT